MQEVDETTVLGDFADARFEHAGEVTRFRREAGRYVVETVGPAGAVEAFDVAYVFGVAPLQQYLVALDDGRLQALSTAWDARPAAEGGQRWFHLYPDERIPHDDALHWTSRAQGWNANCAACHSTGLRKGYDAAADRYATTWQEIDVACEACHGAGSRHVAWAEAGASDEGSKGLAVDFRTGAAGEWRFESGQAIAARSEALRSSREVETCAPCHSRRSPLVGDAKPGRPFLDGYLPALLDEDLYFADGQIQDEVYVWGSFVQSRMHAAGVVCSDCHDPHSLAVSEPPDATCSRCHQPATFATPAHHRHPEGSAGASCLGCHMPSRTYMGVDDRRDHGFFVPRPEIAARVGAPDACTACHTDRDAAWAAASVARLWGEGDGDGSHFADALRAGRRRLPEAGASLAALAADADAPGIVRATALRLLQGYPPSDAGPAIERALRNPDGLLRMAAARSAQALPADARLALLAPSWRDPLRAVRVEAAQSAIGATGRLTPDDEAAYRRALSEYRTAQLAAADTPAARVNLGLLHAQRGANAEARTHYEAALELAPWFVPAYVNLADLMRSGGDEAGALAMLQRALERAPDDGDVHHALGLAQVRLGKRDAALRSLAAAVRNAPRNPHYAYVYAIGLHGEGRTDEARGVLRAALQRHPGDPELLLGLAMLARDAGDLGAARRHARALVERVPGDEVARRLLAELGEGATGE